MREQWQWMGKVPVQATTRCAEAFTHTHRLVYHHSLTPTLSFTLSLSTLLLQVITCLLSQCQSLGRRQRDIGQIIFGKFSAAVITYTHARITWPLLYKWGVRSWSAAGRSSLQVGQAVQTGYTVTVCWRWAHRFHYHRVSIYCKIWNDTYGIYDTFYSYTSIFLKKTLYVFASFWKQLKIEDNLWKLSSLGVTLVSTRSRNWAKPLIGPGNNASSRSRPSLSSTAHHEERVRSAKLFRPKRTTSFFSTHTKISMRRLWEYSPAESGMRKGSRSVCYQLQG